MSSVLVEERFDIGKIFIECILFSSIGMKVFEVRIPFDGLSEIGIDSDHGG